MVLVWILTSTFLVALISLIGIFTIVLKKNLLERILFCLVGFSAGALIGGAFLHILPEALQHETANTVFSYLILGIVMFFLLERYFFWRHCHEGVCNIHAFTYLNLIGDGFHNFLDGIVIAASFLVSIKLGVITTMAVILHEIPQELGDFAVLIYGGFSRGRALCYNFISALCAVAGALVGYFLSGVASGLTGVILPITAGGFIYIATSDLIPQIRNETNPKRSAPAFLAFLAGIAFMALARSFIKD